LIEFLVEEFQDFPFTVLLL